MTRTAVDLAEKTATSTRRADRGGVFHNYVPMLNSCAARFRFG